MFPTQAICTISLSFTYINIFPDYKANRSNHLSLLCDLLLECDLFLCLRFPHLTSLLCDLDLSDDLGPSLSSSDAELSYGLDPLLSACDDIDSLNDASDTSSCVCDHDL